MKTNYLRKIGMGVGIGFILGALPACIPYPAYLQEGELNREGYYNPLYYNYGGPSYYLYQRSPSPSHYVAPANHQSDHHQPHLNSHPSRNRPHQNSYQSAHHRR